MCCHFFYVIVGYDFVAFVCVVVGDVIVGVGVGVGGGFAVAVDVDGVGDYVADVEFVCWCQHVLCCSCCFCCLRLLSCGCWYFLLLLPVLVMLLLVLF